MIKFWLLGSFLTLCSCPSPVSPLPFPHLLHLPILPPSLFSPSSVHFHQHCVYSIPRQIWINTVFSKASSSRRSQGIILYSFYVINSSSPKSVSPTSIQSPILRLYPFVLPNSQSPHFHHFRSTFYIKIYPIFHTSGNYFLHRDLCLLTIHFRLTPFYS